MAHLILGLFFVPALAMASPIKNQATLIFETPFQKHASSTNWDWKWQLSHGEFVRSHTNYYASSGKPSSITAFDMGFQYNSGELKKTFFDGKFFFSSPDNTPQLVIPSAYYSITKGQETWTFGKKPLPWFQDTEPLTLSQFWNPQFSWDPLSPEPQSNLGVFYSNKKELWTFSSFLHFLSLPSYGIFPNIEAGSVSSNHPWVNPFPMEVDLLNEVIPIYYDISLKNFLQGKLFSPGAGFSFQYKKEDFSFRVAYAYKPSNHLLVEAPTELNTVENKIVARAELDNFYHHLISAEGNWKNNNWYFIQNLTYERPKFSETLENTLKQTLSEKILSSTYVGYQWNKANRIYTGVSFTDILRYENNLAINRVIFEPFEKFKNLFLVGWKGAGTLWQKSSSIDMKMIYDFSSKGGVFSTKWNIELKPQLYAHVSLDILGVTSKNSPENTFLNYFRSNDRIQSGVSYVF